MIDTWFFASACLFFLAICAVIRIVPGPTLLDRMVALSTAITLAASGALAIGVTLGNLFYLEVLIIVSLICYGTTIVIVRISPGEGL